MYFFIFSLIFFLINSVIYFFLLSLLPLTHTLVGKLIFLNKLFCISFFFVFLIIFLFTQFFIFIFTITVIPKPFSIFFSFCFFINLSISYFSVFLFLLSCQRDSPFKTLTYSKLTLGAKVSLCNFVFVRFSLYLQFITFCFIIQTVQFKLTCFY